MRGLTNVGGGGGGGQYVWAKYTKTTSVINFIEYVMSKDSTKYPDDGYQGNYYYVLVDYPQPDVEIVSWANGTDAQIVTMVEAASAGKIALSDYWSVGDERTVALSSMAATGVGESHAAQNVTMILMNAGGKTLSNGDACQFIVGQKQLLNYAASSLEDGYMNSSNTNTGGWSSSARRTWCNNIYYNAIPSTLQPIFKQFTNTTGVGGGATSGLQTTTDYFALPAEKEIFGTNTYSQSDEAAALTQFTYYATSSNRIKYYSSGGGHPWWERSPYSGSNVFCIVNSDGSAGYTSASNTYGFAPFGCI